MKIILTILVLATMFLGFFNSALAIPLKERQIRINFQARLVDNKGLSYDGNINVEAWYYKSRDRDPSNLIYSEQFASVKVEHGMFRVPLFLGTRLSGSALVDELSKHGELFVDIKTNGKTLIELEPMSKSLNAIRTEYSKKAQKLHDPLVLAVDQMPAHDATHITTGRMPLSLLPAIDASKIASGTFAVAQIPALPAEIVASGTFSPSAIPSDLSATMFTTGVLSEGVISQDFLRSGDLFIGTGERNNAETIPIPDGFSKSQCAWVVGIRLINGSAGVDQFALDTDASGMVHCRWSPGEAYYFTNPTTECSANYMIICKK